jgi:hypothetical protein
MPLSTVPSSSPPPAHGKCRAVRPTINYAPRKFGKNNIKVIGASRRATILLPTAGDDYIAGNTGNAAAIRHGSAAAALYLSVARARPGRARLALNMLLVTISKPELRACQRSRRHPLLPNQSQQDQDRHRHAGWCTDGDDRLQRTAMNGYTLASADGNASRPIQFQPDHLRQPDP